VTFFDPEGFDPFAFAFGPSRSPFRPGGMPTAPRPPAAFDLEAARQAFRRGDYRALVDAPRATPFDPDAQQARALALFVLGRYDEAGRALRQALNGDPAAAWDWPTLGRFYRRPEDYVRQYQALRRAAARPVTPEVHLLLAYHALILHRPDDARPALEAALRLRPGDPIARDLQDALPPE
jgi:tetratricopeptide (TPR) repeat protein